MVASVFLVLGSICLRKSDSDSRSFGGPKLASLICPPSERQFRSSHSEEALGACSSEASSCFFNLAWFILLPFFWRAQMMAFFKLWTWNNCLFEFARSLHNPTSSKAVASPNDQCDGHGEHGEQHHLGTSGWTKNSSQKVKGSVPDEADVWILQGRQICQSQVACNLRSLGGSPFQAMKKSFRVQKFRMWGCKLVRYIQIRFVHPLGLTLTHQKMSLKP